MARLPTLEEIRQFGFRTFGKDDVQFDILVAARDATALEA
jgi:hypothetical protein